MHFKTTILSTVVMALVGCNGSDSAPKTTKVSFQVSDAPVEDASEVVVAFDAIELIHENGTRYFLDVVDTDQSNTYQQVDLLSYQGTDARMILSDEEIEVGRYKELIVHTKSGAAYNWVTANGQHTLKVPSNKLRLGSFETTEQAVQAFTIEFDLRRALVMRGNTSSNNGYNLKPHGVTIVENSSAASLKGQVDPSLFTAGEGCDLEGGNIVYLYQGHGYQTEQLIDSIDVNDEDYVDGGQLPEEYVSPFAAASVADTGSYEFGYLPPGDYTVAFTCNGYDEDPVNYDPDIVIANPSEQIAELTLPATSEWIHDFN